MVSFWGRSKVDQKLNWLKKPRRNERFGFCASDCAEVEVSIWVNVPIVIDKAGRKETAQANLGSEKQSKEETRRS